MEGEILVTEEETVVEGESDWLVLGVRVEGSGATGVGRRAREQVPSLGAGEVGIS